MFKNPPKGKGSETNPTSPVAGQLEKWAPRYLSYIIPACPGLGGGGLTSLTYITHFISIKLPKIHCFIL